MESVISRSVAAALPGRRLSAFAALGTLSLAMVTLVARSSFGQSVPDLVIKAQRTFDVNGIVVSETLYLKDRRQRRDAIVSDPKPRSLFSIVTDCQERRTLMLNHDTKIFAYRAYKEPGGHDVTMRAQSDTPADARPPRAEITIDSTDTGERRRVGSYIARGVKTTTTTDYLSGGIRRKWVGHEDGWYIDLPKSYCGGIGTGVGVLPNPSGDTSDDFPDDVRVERRGSALLGFPIERTSDYATVKLLQFSEAPLNDEVFSVPAGYRPALPDPYSSGGYDMSRPDTVANRVKTYWRLAVDWTNYLFR